MFKKKPKKKPAIKKSIKKTSIKKKIEPEPLPEPEPEEEYEPELLVTKPEILEPESEEQELEPEEEEYESEEDESDAVEFEEEYIPENSFYEETPKPRAREVNDSYQILMVVENVTVSEFVIESLERVRKPINVLHMEDGALALKELKHKYDVLILDFDMKSIESKFMLSEMEKWGIMTPIIVLSDEDPKLEKYILNIEAVLKKKQKAINNIGKILQKLL